MALVISLLGCGGSFTASDPPACSAGTPFDNQTNGGATQQQLMTIWLWAQNDLATNPIPLNPVTVITQGGVDKCQPAGDVRCMPAQPDAMNIEPDCARVMAVPDLSAAHLAQLGYPGLKDPTGIIAAPNGAASSYCYAYTEGNTVYVAASMVLSDGATGWEFENIILERLGIPVGGR